MKWFNKIKTNSFDKYRFLFVNYFEIRYGRTLIVKMFGVPIFIMSRKKWFWKKIDRVIGFANSNSSESNIFFFRHNLGENVAYLMSIESFVRSNNLKNVVLVAINDVQESLLKLFYRDKYKIIKYELRIEDLRRFIQNDIVRYKNNIYIYAPGVYLSEQLIEKFNKRVNYTIFDFVCETLNINKDKTEFVRPVENVNMNNYIVEKKLQHDFVMIFPDAQSMIQLTDGFWLKLVEGLQEKGYKVFVNGKDTKYLGTVTDFLDLEQTFALAKKSKGIIGMGSGIAMMLAQTGIKGDYIYTEFHDKWLGYTADIVGKIYSLKKYAINNNVKEHIVNNSSDEFFLLNKILSEY